MDEDSQDLTGGNKPERDERGRLLPGNTANPAGRPKGSISITSAIKRKLEECPEGNKKTYLELLVERVMKKAIIDQDVPMLRTLWQYVDGMPTQKTELTGGGGGGLSVSLNLIPAKTLEQDTSSE